jgi:hypothetical protein
VLAAEHLLDLAGLYFLIERVERLAELDINGFAGLSPLGEHRQVVALLAKRQHQIAIELQASATLEDLLCVGLVFPEIGESGAGLDAGQFVVGSGCFKDSYADRQPGG